jgi:hypothetical protein
LDKSENVVQLLAAARDLPLFRLALWSIQPPIQYVTQVLSSGAKQVKHDADHSSTSSAKVKNY